MFSESFHTWLTALKIFTKQFHNTVSLFRQTHAQREVGLLVYTA